MRKDSNDHVVLADLPDKVRGLLEVFDVNGDGSLDAGEIKNLVAALKARRRHTDEISLKLFPPRARQKLSMYDKDGDGSVNAAELMAACDAHRREQERSKNYKRLLVVAIGLVLLLSACIVLLTGLVVKANKDTSAAGGALTGFVNGVPDSSTLRCGTMMVDLEDKMVTDLGNKTESGADGKRRRLTVDVDASTVLCSTVAQYCAALAEGAGDSVSTKTSDGALIKMRLLGDRGLCAPLLAGEAVPATAEGTALASHADNPHFYAEDQVFFAACDRCAAGDEDDTCDLLLAAEAEAPEAPADGGDRQLGQRALINGRALRNRHGRRLGNKNISRLKMRNIYFDATTDCTGRTCNFPHDSKWKRGYLASGSCCDFLADPGCYGVKWNGQCKNSHPGKYCSNCKGGNHHVWPGTCASSRACN
jgi:Ca2+-binding EF-hand superfamily protein